ncbi:MAG: M28 family metallopeptidase, partial [Thermoanaerobaculum sp.]|nr:M28 family metallopeptidase [Thermoanaerobaculum sp.]
MRGTPLRFLFFTLLPVSLAAQEATASFWGLQLPRQRHPLQVAVKARLVVQSEHFQIFLASGNALPPENRLPPGGLLAVLDRLEAARRQLQQWQPKALPWEQTPVLVWENGAFEPAFFSPFDLLGEAEALRFGFHANPVPVIFARFPYSGELAWRNLASLVEAFFLLSNLPTSDPFPNALSRAVARWFACRVGVAPPRYLWGEQDHHGPGPSPWAPQRPDGWGPLFVEFLAQTLDPPAVLALVEAQGAPTGPLYSTLANRRPQWSVGELVPRFWRELWFGQGPTGGAWNSPLAFAPRPQPLAWMVASRPASGQAALGVGGGGVLLVQGDGQPSLPLALQGDPSGRWVGSGQKVSLWSTSAPEPVIFDSNGFARVELPQLTPDERYLVFVATLPHPAADVDPRILPLQWGLAWSPRLPASRVQDRLRELATKRLGEGGPARRTRVLESLKALAGIQPLQPGGGGITTRYAWHPAAEEVVQVLLQEATRRGLVAEKHTFLRRTPWDTAAEWHNVIIPPRRISSPRLPLVLAAHWDACTGDPWDSYRRALSLRDNALGVVTALEFATLVAARPPSLPVEVVLLAGGCHDAAGAQAFLATRPGPVAVWVELERLWSLQPGDPSKLVVRLGCLL